MNQLTIPTSGRINIGVSAKSLAGIGLPFKLGAPVRCRFLTSAFFVPVFGGLSGPLRRAVPNCGKTNPNSPPLIRLVSNGGGSQTKVRRT